MSDIRFNQWLHNSGTGGVSQVDGGHVGIGTTNPEIAVHSGNNKILNVGIVTASTYYGDGSNLSGIVGGGTSLSFNDNIGAYFGNSQDLKIHHDGNHSYIDDQGTGNLRLRSGTLEILNLAGNKTSAIFSSGGGQTLNFNNSSKFTTTNTGVTVTGSVVASGAATLGNGSGLNFGDTSARIIGESGSSGLLRFDTNGGEKVRITSTGYVGINTSTPQYPLHVAGHTTDASPDGIGVLMGLQHNHALIHLNAESDMGCIIDFSTPNNDRKGGILYYHSNNATVANRDAMQFHTAGSERLRILSNGRIGINTASTNRQMTIVDSAGGGIGVVGTNAGIYMGTHSTSGFQANAAIARAAATNYHITNSVAGDLCIAAESTKSILFGTGASAGTMAERMRIRSDGYLVKGGGLTCAFNVSGTNMARTNTSGYVCDFDDDSSSGHFDSGNNFNTSTHKFVAPVSGYYYFFTNIRLDAFNSGYIRTAILSTSYHAGTTYYTLPATGHVITYADNGSIQTVQTSTVMYLGVNQEAWVYQDPSSDSSYTCYLNESSFGGYFIG